MVGSSSHLRSRRGGKSGSTAYAVCADEHPGARAREQDDVFQRQLRRRPGRAARCARCAPSVAVLEAHLRARRLDREDERRAAVDDAALAQQLQQSDEVLVGEDDARVVAVLVPLQLEEHALVRGRDARARLSMRFTCTGPLLCASRRRTSTTQWRAPAPCGTGVRR